MIHLFSCFDQYDMPFGAHLAEKKYNVNTKTCIDVGKHSFICKK